MGNVARSGEREETERVVDDGTESPHTDPMGHELSEFATSTPKKGTE